MCSLGLILEEFCFGEVGIFHCLWIQYTSLNAWESPYSPSNVCPLLFLADRIPSWWTV